MGCVFIKNKRILPEEMSYSRSTALEESHEPRSVVLFVVKEEQSCMEQSEFTSKRQSVVYNSSRPDERFYFTENDEIGDMHFAYSISK